MQKNGKTMVKSGRADRAEDLISPKDSHHTAATQLTIGYGQSQDFAKEKYYIQVAVSCDQNEETILRAGGVGVRLLKQLDGQVRSGLFDENG